MTNNILIGADPELFVKQEGIFRSAYGLINGDKHHPEPVPEGAIQIDGMALEFNVDPCANGDELVHRVRSVLDTLRERVKGYELSITPVAVFEKSHFDEQPEKARELGCDPDFNAWTGAENPRPDNTTTMRTAGGHVHVGWRSPKDIIDAEHTGMAYALVRELDFHLGLPSLVYDKESERRAMYGKAGACRIKNYGVEYRSLSNKWISEDGLIRWVDRATRNAVAAVQSGKFLVNTYGDIQEIINNSRVNEAKRIIKDAKLDCDFGNRVESLRHAA